MGRYKKTAPAKPMLFEVKCPREDSNLQSHYRNHHLKVARLPISPPGQMCGEKYIAQLQSVDQLESFILENS